MHMYYDMCTDGRVTTNDCHFSSHEILKYHSLAIDDQYVDWKYEQAADRWFLEDRWMAD